jgi:murein DD-endopeptidase MepM/ murein hydrolase activator NlpD
VSEEAPLSAASLSAGDDDFNPFRARWVLALGLLAAAASLFLIESLYAVMDHDLHFAMAPAPFQWDSVAKAGVAGLRGDRLDPQKPNASVAKDEVHIEQLSASGSSVRPFTHVVAYLAHVSVAAQEPMATAAAFTTEPPAADASEPVSALGPTPASSDAALETAVAASRSAEPKPLGEPINVTPVPESPPARGLTRRIIVARPGDDLAKILRALAVPEQQVQDIASVFSQAEGDAPFVGGEKISIVADRSSGEQAPLEVGVQRESAPAWTVARADDGSYAEVAAAEASDRAAQPPPSSAADSLSETVDQSVQDSIYGLVQSDGVDRALVDQIVRLCGHDFDLDAPVASTDRIEFLYTRGDYNEPQLRFVRLTAQGQTKSYYRFTAADDGSIDYYDQSGRSVTKFLLRKPAPEGRLGDGFGWRMHPILKVERFHAGVDYDAPMGSPVEAAGAGVVEKIAQEVGYGKYIRVKHDLGYETTYAHLSGYARGIRVGTRVRQGEVIAYVGSTGYSTGPHLYYEIRINGRNVDPLRIRLADGRVLSGPVLDDFEKRREVTDELVKASAVAETAAPGASLPD